MASQERFLLRVCVFFYLPNTNKLFHSTSAWFCCCACSISLSRLRTHVFIHKRTHTLTHQRSLPIFQITDWALRSVRVFFDICFLFVFVFVAVRIFMFLAPKTAKSSESMQNEAFPRLPSHFAIATTQNKDEVYKCFNVQHWKNNETSTGTFEA